ncbi:hypothetical protein MLP_03990 [Microlunatus phosphovorus NM-1]|uniref:Uncharacterized protein n=1 Tax=Microlunatus phosphovorus (strain ATCC 700054 / DSM 10555 / JCM 9379 / NBRC 101784 / NCIMB 13414 / VKM Ac-1990 / NM-1) TaxID=1032480 RepID=F5XJ87_MICPN|nr:hypothetical protein MLP_03990 [Microlunatus phosphovorus NM-1]
MALPFSRDDDRAVTGLSPQIHQELEFGLGRRSAGDSAEPIAQTDGGRFGPGGDQLPTFGNLGDDVLLAAEPVRFVRNLLDQMR